MVVVAVELTEAAGSWIDLTPTGNGTGSRFGSPFPSRYEAMSRGDALISISAVVAEAMVATGRNNGVDQWPSASSINERKPCFISLSSPPSSPPYRFHGSFSAEFFQTPPAPAAGKGMRSNILTVQSAN